MVLVKLVEFGIRNQHDEKTMKRWKSLRLSEALWASPKALRGSKGSEKWMAVTVNGHKGIAQADSPSRRKGQIQNLTCLGFYYLLLRLWVLRVQRLRIFAMWPRKLCFYFVQSLVLFSTVCVRMMMPDADELSLISSTAWTSWALQRGVLGLWKVTQRFTTFPSSFHSGPDLQEVPGANRNRWDETMFETGHKSMSNKLRSSWN